MAEVNLISGLGVGIARAANTPIDDVVVRVTGWAVVNHGSDDSVARPAVDTVYWRGSVAPLNREVGDFWLETNAFDGS
jgi:hypothetical protein